MLNKVKKTSRDLKKFTNYLERRFLSKNISEEDLDKMEKIKKIINYDYSPDNLSENFTIKNAEKINYIENNKLGKLLEKIGVLYFLNLICKSPLELDFLISEIFSYIEKIIFFFDDKNNFNVFFLNEKINIIEDNEMSSLGKFLDNDIFINFKLIKKEKININEIILHEVIHAVFYKTKIQKKIDDLFGIKKIEELFCDIISKNWKYLLNLSSFENNEKRIIDFNLIQNFIKTKTNINPKEFEYIEIGAGNGIFTSIVRSHGLKSRGIDNNNELDQIKENFIEYKDFNDFVLLKNKNIIHCNLFMYIEEKNILKFFEKNINFLDFIYITYNTERKNNIKDLNRINFLNENFFIDLAKKFNFEYFEIEKNKKRIFCKKEVLKIGS